MSWRSSTGDAGGLGQQFKQRVSLDFVGADIVQILKALSIQAGVNIITSPDASPPDKPVRLTISLTDVDLEKRLITVQPSRFARSSQLRAWSSWLVARCSSVLTRV